ncbi:MAG: CDP-2,3-bis-(O-geranylgeranyl)-sn-glycerol synthase [Candidatus Micrarchaeia archaeon]|jgi:CDP-2,3-bis-(O-geranylgeranyl)-sn-glycerol synthase
MDLLALLIFIIPCYIANAAPVLLGGGQPLDFGASFSDGRRIFGNAKTVRGFVGGVAAGTVAGGTLALYFFLPVFTSAWEQFLSGFLLSLGALVGDALGSFVKRRAGIGPGKPFFLDQLGFIVVGLLLAYPVAHALYSPEGVIFLLVLSWLLHIVTNAAANRFGLKSVPW